MNRFRTEQFGPNGEYHPPQGTTFSKQTRKEINKGFNNLKRVSTGNVKTN